MTASVSWGETDGILKSGHFKNDLETKGFVSKEAGKEKLYEYNSGLATANSLGKGVQDAVLHLKYR